MVFFGYQVCLKFQVDFITNKIDYIMLKILGLTLILLCATVYADDDTGDNQDKLQLVDQKTFYTYLPSQVWYQLGTYQHHNKSMSLKAGFFNTSAVSQNLIRQYAMMGIQRDFFTLKCKTYKQQDKTKYEMYIDSMGLPDAGEFYLVSPSGRILCSKSTFDKSSEFLQDFYMNLGTCWIGYERSEIPLYLYTSIKGGEDGDEDEETYLEELIQLCKEGWNEWVYWNLKDYVCVDKNIVGKNPDMMKHGDRLNFLKNTP